MAPTADEQIHFLVKLQRLLEEGQFVASYKFALLLALADLSVERGDDTGGPLPVSVESIAEKFIRYYWRQGRAVPDLRTGARSSAKLRQASGNSQHGSGCTREIR